MGLDELIDTTGGEEYKDSKEDEEEEKEERRGGAPTAGGMSKEEAINRVENADGTVTYEPYTSKDEEGAGARPDHNNNIERDALYKICHKCSSVSVPQFPDKGRNSFFYQCTNEDCGIGAPLSWNEWYSDSRFLGGVDFVEVMKSLDCNSELEGLKEDPTP